MLAREDEREKEKGAAVSGDTFYTNARRWGTGQRKVSCGGKE
jgi:hypothetical protein